MGASAPCGVLSGTIGYDLAPRGGPLYRIHGFYARDRFHDENLVRIDYLIREMERFLPE